MPARPHGAPSLYELASAPLRFPLAVANTFAAPIVADLQRAVRRSLGLSGEPPVRVVDAEAAFLPPGGVARQVHGDLPGMVIGGLAALLLQSLHPLAMAGVADHSNYQSDPFGRLQRTAAFITATTFGTKAQAAEAIARVKRVHRVVVGQAPDGRRYSAADPDLLTWVHVAEVSSFLAAAQRFGPRRLDAATCDRYYAETAAIARALGARAVPESNDEVAAYLRGIRPDLKAGPQALEARDFLLRGVAERPSDRAVHALVAAAAVVALPAWARAELKIPSSVLLEGAVAAPGVRAVSAAVRLVMRPPPEPSPRAS